ncbi:hypothetical protein [Intestinibacter sp.]
MDKKQIVEEDLKYVLYTIFDNYENLLKKIYIVIDSDENSEQISEEVLKKINQNTPPFIKKVLSFNDDGQNSMTKLKKDNKNLKIVTKYELDDEDNIVIDIFNKDFDKLKYEYSYETKFVVDYILSLDDIRRSRFFKELSKNKKDDEETDENDKKDSNDKGYLNINDLYNICVSKTLCKDGDDISKISNWIYNTINPNVLHTDLFEEMLKAINEQLDNSKFDSYLEHILNKKENKSLEYISPSNDLYQLLLFEDMLRVDYKDKCNVKIDLDVDYIGEWWSKNILPEFKKKYGEKDLANQLELEVKKNEIIDLHGKNFEKFKNKIICEIEKDYSQTEVLNEDTEKQEKIYVENIIKNLNAKTVAELEETIEKIDIKYENNKQILKNYCSDKFIDILENKEQDYNLKELEQFLNDNEEYLNNKASVYFEVCIQKQLQKLEENLLNDICDVKNLKDLEELHNKILENGEFVKCEDIECIIFRKMESIIKICNLAEINNEDNIRISNSIYDNTSSIELDKYPIAEVLICRDIKINLNDVETSLEDLSANIEEVQDVVLNNCIFNCEYYNMNIQINDSEDYHVVKFRYLNDLADYIKLKEGNKFLLNLKSMNKDVQHKKRVFNKGNSEIIKEIDEFYLEKQTAKS